MIITGTHFNYYHICHRKLWLFANGINMEHESELVEIGKLVHASSYPQRRSHYEEVAIDGVKVDYFDTHKNTIHEIKKSNKMDVAHEWQLKYYMYVFEQHGIEHIKGILEYPTLRKTQEVFLTDVDRNDIQLMQKDIELITQQTTCPPIIKKSICKNCSYYEFCHIQEVQE